MMIAFEFETPEMAQGFVTAALGRWGVNVTADHCVVDVHADSTDEIEEARALAEAHGCTIEDSPDEDAPPVLPAPARRTEVTLADVERTVASAPKTKGKKSRSKARRYRRHVSRINPEVRAYWRWEELYSQALTALIQSLAVGRKMSAATMVAFARDVADKGLALREARRPKNDPRED